MELARLSTVHAQTIRPADGKANRCDDGSQVSDLSHKTKLHKYIFEIHQLQVIMQDPVFNL